jgi:predicted dehydrogenase
MRFLTFAATLSIGVFNMPNLAAALTSEKPLRAGIIGLDTSHVVAFTELLNAKDQKPDLAGVRVVAAFPAGSPDVASSRDRIDGFTKKIREMDVEIVDSIDALLAKVDVVLLESVDGRPHLAQARPVIAAGKPLFIDKPVAGSLADAIAIFRLAEEKKVPCFSSSSLRFSPQIASVRNDAKIGSVLGCLAFSPCHTEPHHPDLFWYGVHGVETLYAIMGPGCKHVSRTHSDGADVVTGVWSDGRVGTFRGLRQGKLGYGATVFGANGNVSVTPDPGYRPLVVEMVKFFRTGKPPVAAAETIEMFAFMEAADASKKAEGRQISIEETIRRAGQEADARR